MSIEKKVSKILTDIFGNEITVSKNFSQDEVPSWDSMKHLDVIFALEEEFSVSINADDFLKLNSRESIVNYLVDHNEA